MTNNKNPIQQGPNGGLKFRVIPLGDTGGPSSAALPFSPYFYPDRFNQTSEKELRREGQQCRGEDVSVKNFKNADFHATGVLLEENLRTFQMLLQHDGPVDMITPVSPQGGLKVFIKKGEVGEIDGWFPGQNGIEGQWLLNYTLDFVSTGEDEYGNSDGNSIVTDRLEEVPNDIPELSGVGL